MNTNLLGGLKCLFLAFFILAGTQINLSSSPKISTKKTLTFTDVEKEFKFAKPLSENTKQIILKKFGTVQNYHDSIIAKRNNPRHKNIIVTGHPTEADSAALSIFNLSLEELQSKGIKVTIDPKLNNQLPVKSK